MAYRAEVGTKVTVVDKLDRRDYSMEAQAARKPGVTGVITGHLGGHGICYKVLHEDGTEAFYDPDELSSEGIFLSVSHDIDYVHES